MIFNQTADDRKVRSFTLSSTFIEQFQGKQPNWGPLGYFTYKRTYARPLPEGGTEEFWQTTQRVVEGCFNIQKIHCRRMGMPWKEDKAQNSAQEMYQRIWDFKFTPPGRGLWMMGTDLIYERGSACLNNCFAGDTEIITRDGVKKIRDVAGTTQTILSSNSLWIDAPIRNFGEQQLYELVLTRQGMKKTIFCTGDHRWFAKDRRVGYRGKGYTEFKTTELRPGVHRLQYSFGAGVKNIIPSPFGIAHGFSFGDGRTIQGDNNDNDVPLIGSKDASLKPYFSACTERPRLDGVSYGGIPNFFKSLPSIHENKTYLLGWLMGYFAADGTVKAGGQAILSSVSKENILFVRDVCSVLGLGYYSIRSETRESNLTHAPFTMYSVCLMRDNLPEDFFLIPQHQERFKVAGTVISKHWTVESVSPTDRVEQVYCATVDKYHTFTLDGNILTGNCGFTSTEYIGEDFADPFAFLMDMSMLGVGIGGDTRGVGKVKIQAPKTTQQPYVVEDSREGWADLLRVILNSFVGKKTYPTTIDYSRVRGRGTPINTFGGVASGPKPLHHMVQDITRLLIPEGMSVSFEMDQAEDESTINTATVTFTGEGVPYKISSANIVDIFNFVGKCVVSGGVRRSAEIMFGEPDDDEFRNLKRDKAALNDRRWVSNNSILAKVGMDYGPFMDQVTQNGEPGFFWLENARAYSRMGREPDHKDRRAAGCNPCSEQTLEHRELCTLVETFPANHDTYEDFLKTLKMAYLYAKTVTLIPTHDPRTNAVMMRNRRIGCSMSGITQAIARFGRHTFFEWCDGGYAYINNELDEKYSSWLGIPRSIKKTSVKPSGTVSLLCGATPGIHYPHSEYYIRHIRVANTSPLVEAAKKAGYDVHPDTYAADTSVVAFPVHEKNYVKGKSEVTVWEQFINAVDMQKHWADNQVSVTVSFRPSEKKDLQACLETFDSQLKGVSMLPLLDADHGYDYPPYVAIDKETYEAMASRITPMSMDKSGHEVDEKFCTTDKCEMPVPNLDPEK